MWVTKSEVSQLIERNKQNIYKQNNNGTHTQTHIQRHRQTDKYTQAHRHRYIDRHTQIQTHTYTSTHTDTDTCILMPGLASFSLHWIFPGK